MTDIFSDFSSDYNLFTSSPFTQDGFASFAPEAADLYQGITGLDPNTYIPNSSALFNPDSSISTFNPYITGAASNPYLNNDGGLQIIDNFVDTGDFSNSFPVTDTLIGLGSGGASEIYQWAGTQDPSLLPLLNSSPIASNFPDLSLGSGDLGSDFGFNGMPTLNPEFDNIFANTLGDMGSMLGSVGVYI